MTRQPDAAVEPEGESTNGWPAGFRGVAETVVATRESADTWNQAALGLHGPFSGPDPPRDGTDPAVTARTWGQTRTRRNFERQGGGYVQFTTGVGDFVAAALDVYETDAPILRSADAWARIEVEPVERGTEDGTAYVEWGVLPVEGGIRRRRVPTLNRGRAAVVEATVAASRLGVEGYDERALLDRLVRLGSVVERCGSPDHDTAFEQIDELTGWRDRLE